ncbi:MAG: WD40 repeat domain-containing protein, partial [Desulfobacterales bacterium]|nr:WD40 repeat domain-containing protein [Desulfobacterales bacterium]
MAGREKRVVITPPITYLTSPSLLKMSPIRSIRLQKEEDAGTLDKDKTQPFPERACGYRNVNKRTVPRCLMKKNISSALFICVFSFCILNAALASETLLFYPQSGNSSPLHSLIFSKDSKYLTSYSFDKAIVWEVASGRSYGEFHVEEAVPAALVNSLGFKTFKEGSGLARSRQAGTDSGRVVYSDDAALVAEIPNTNAAAILIKEAKSGTVLKELGFIRDSIRRIAVSEDQTTLYSGSGFSDLAIWDTAGFLKRKVSTASLLEDNRFLL